MTNYWLKRQYAETSTEPDGLSKRGLIYLLAWSEGEPDTPGLWETVP